MSRLLATCLLLAFCAYLYVLHIQAQHMFPPESAKLAAPVTASVGIQLSEDDVIDASDVKFYDFKRIKSCLTPTSSACVYSEPEVVIQ